jgi:hypothetical protein
MPRIWWTDRKQWKSLLYKGHPIHFEAIQQLFTSLEQAAIHIWENNILMGLDLHVDIGEIADDLSCRNIRYSFLTYVRNTAFTNRDRLCQAILADPALRKQFILHADKDGLPVWNVIALCTWLQNYSKFHGNQLFHVEMIGGAPGRITEMTALPYHNTKTQQWALYAFGNYIGILCRYHKGSALTGVDKQIPHALDAVTADLTIQDLTIARPFAELAITIVYPGNKEFAKLYLDLLWINNTKMFDTPIVTQLMQNATRPILELEIGANDWRHLQTSFSKKLCPRLEELIQEDQLDTITAEQACHSRATEVRIYGLSHDAVSGVAEDTFPLYLEASTDWQIITRTVPGGLRLSYKEAQSSQFQNLVQAGIINNTSDPIGKLVISKQLAEDVIAQLKPAFGDMILDHLKPLLSTIMTESVDAAIKNNMGLYLHFSQIKILLNMQSIFFRPDNKNSKQTCYSPEV